MPVDKYNKDIIINTKPHNGTLEPSTGSVIYVREQVAKKLTRIQNKLTAKGLFLTAVYGWRSPEVQKSVFDDVTNKYQEENPEWTNKECMIEADRYIGHPKIAPHPTGGAIDLLLQDNNGIFLDYDTKIHELMTKKTYLKSPEISKEAMENRLFLSSLMESEGFYTYTLEWWHYDYGDKLWGFYGKNGDSIYVNIFPDDNR